MNSEKELCGCGRMVRGNDSGNTLAGFISFTPSAEIMCCAAWTITVNFTECDEPRRLPEIRSFVARSAQCMMIVFCVRKFSFIIVDSVSRGNDNETYMLRGFPL